MSVPVDERERREAVRQAYVYRCGYCGVHEEETGGALEIDHFQPRIRGGGDDLDNLVYCCPTCNRLKELGSLDETHHHTLLQALSEARRGRLDQPPEPLLTVLLFGPSGVGKSQLLNALAGEVIASSPFLRPTTRIPTVYAHEAVRALSGCSSTCGGYPLERGMELLLTAFLVLVAWRLGMAFVWADYLGVVFVVNAMTLLGFILLFGYVALSCCFPRPELLWRRKLAACQRSMWDQVMEQMESMAADFLAELE